MPELKGTLMNAPKSVDIAITGRCNLACKYCFYADEMVALSNLPTSDWLQFFAELGRLKVMTVGLTGGEIFTHPDLFQLIDGIIANHMRYNLTTNGTLITEDTIEQFAIGKRRIRLDSIQISIDGSSPEVHDKSRPYSFKRALQGLKLLLANGFPTTVRVTINRYNIDDLENTAHLLLDEVGLPAFSTNEAYACGATESTEGGVRLSPEQRLQAMEVLTRLSEQYPGRISAQAGPLAYANDLRRIKQLQEQGENGIPGRGYLTGCGGVFNKLAILHDGTIVPCHVLSDLHMGRINHDSLEDIWRNHPIMKRLRDRRQIPLSSIAHCKGCELINFCTGGCPGGALFALGDDNTYNPESCYHNLFGEDPFTSVAAVLERKEGNA